MAEAPGIHFDEGTPAGVATPVGNSTAAFIGTSERGRVDRTGVVKSWSDYLRDYGSFGDNVDLAIHVWNHFKNLGGPLRLLRVAPADAVGASNTTGVLKRGAAAVAFNLKAANPGVWGNGLSAGFVRNEIVVRAAQAVTDADGNDLPNSTDNEDSLDTIALPVESLVGVNAGDVYDVFSSAGTWDSDGPAVVLGVDSVNRRVYLNKLNGTAMDGRLRTSSQHRARTIAQESLAASATSILLESTESITPGSLLTLHLFSHYKSYVVGSFAQMVHVVVDRVVGRRVYFHAASTNTVTLPAKTPAVLRATSGANGVHFESVADGPIGNSLTVQVRIDQASTAVVVSGTTIRIDLVEGATIANLITAVTNSAAASALITATLVGNSATTMFAVAATALSGGANLSVTSQEFFMGVYLDGTLVQKHDYLSLIPTSVDYIGDRLGGNASLFLPDDKNESRYLIVDGYDGDIDSGVSELEQMPRALTGVGLASGSDGSTISDTDVIGAESPRSGIYLLPEAGDIAVACAPGFSSVAVQSAGAALAKANGTFQWLLDMPEDLTTRDAMIVYRQQTLGISNDFVGLFGPWGYITDPRPWIRRGALLKVPVTPVVTGLVNQAVNEVGSHGSVGNRLTNLVRLTYNALPAEHADLNEAGISIFTAVSQRGIYLMGDRTLLEGPQDSRKFGNVRRWLCYFRRNIAPALSKSLFAPVNAALYSHISHVVDTFLGEEWKKGALYPSEARNAAFFVKCDAETTTTADLAEGQVVCEVAVSPVVPAEKIKFKLDVALGGISVTEVGA